MKRIIALLMVIALAVLAGCGSPEERRDEFLQSAQQYFEQGDYEEARVQLRNALKVDPDYPQAYMWMGRVNFELKLWRNSFSAFSRALEGDPDMMEAHLGLGRLYLMLGQLDKAREEADSVLAVEPKNPEANLILAAILSRTDDVDGAKRIAKQVIADSPEQEDAYAFLSFISFRLGEGDQAVDVLKQGVQVLPESKALKTQLASTLAQLERYDEARPMYEAMAASEEENVEMQRQLIRFYLKIGDNDAALSHAESLLAKYPDDPGFRLNLGELYGLLDRPVDQLKTLQDGIGKGDDWDLRLATVIAMRAQGKLDEAEQLARQTADLDPAHEKALTARRMLADILVQKLEYEQAKKDLEIIFEHNPKDMEAQVFMGRIHLAQGRAGDAIALFRQVIDAQPDLLPVYGFLSQAHLVNNERQLASETLERALEKNPDYTPARNALVNMLVADNKYDQGVTLLRQALAKQPTDLGLMSAIGDLYVLKKDYGMANRSYKQMLEVNANSGLAVYKLGRAALLQGKYDEALRLFEALLEADSKAFPAAEGIVGVYIAKARHDEALAFCREWMQTEPGPAPYDLMGRVEAHRGNLEKAEEFFLKAVELNPDWMNVYQRIGGMYLQAGKRDVAVARFEKALEENPQDVGVAYVLGLLYQQGGDVAGAEAMYQKVLDLRPSFLPAVNNLAYLYADTSTDPVKLDKALTLALKAASTGSPQALDTLGWTYHKTGNNELAFSSLMEALDKNKDDPTILYHMAVVQKALGNTDMAKQYAEKVTSAEGEVPEKELAEELLKSL